MTFVPSLMSGESFRNFFSFTFLITTFREGEGRVGYVLEVSAWPPGQKEASICFSVSVSVRFFHVPLHVKVPVCFCRGFLSINHLRLGKTSHSRGHVRVREDTAIFPHYRMTSGLTDRSGIDRVSVWLFHIPLYLKISARLSRSRQHSFPHPCRGEGVGNLFF